MVQKSENSLSSSWAGHWQTSLNIRKFSSDMYSLLLSSALEALWVKSVLSYMWHAFIDLKTTVILLQFSSDCWCLLWARNWVKGPRGICVLGMQWFLNKLTNISLLLLLLSLFRPRNEDTTEEFLCFLFCIGVQQRLTICVEALVSGGH